MVGHEDGFGGRHRFSSAIVLLVPKSIDHPDQHRPAHGKHAGKSQGERQATVEIVTNGKQRRPDHEATRNPPERRLAHVVAVERRLGLGHARGLTNIGPTWPGGMHLPVECKQLISTGGCADESGDQPTERGERH